MLGVAQHLTIASQFPNKACNIRYNHINPLIDMNDCFE